MENIQAGLPGHFMNANYINKETKMENPSLDIKLKKEADALRKDSDIVISILNAIKTDIKGISSKEELADYLYMILRDSTTITKLPVNSIFLILPVLEAYIKGTAITGDFDILKDRCLHSIETTYNKVQKELKLLIDCFDSGDVSKVVDLIINLSKNKLSSKKNAT